MPAPKKYPYDPKFKNLSNPDLPYEEKVQLTREFATKYPKVFNQYIDKINPDPYRGTRKMASMLIQQYPERFPGATPDQVVDMMQKIAMTESKDRNIPQMRGGPGRGYFQIETTTAPTALKRYQNYQDILAPLSAVPLPKIKPTPSKPVMVDGKQVPTASVMNLSKDQQAMLALSNIAANAKDKGIVDVVNPMDTWLNYHWAGSAEQRPERMKHWADTFRTTQAKGGRLTKEGKKIRKYGPRPDYMNQNPSGMTTGPITQRSIGNTPGGGYMQFAEGGFTTQERQDKGLYVHQGETPYDLVYNQDGTYSSVPMGMAPHYSGQTNVPTSPCGPGFAIDYDENGREVCVPVGLGQPASPTPPAPKPSYGGYSGYTPYVPVLPRRTMQEDYADPGFAMNLTRRDLRQLARRSREAQEQFEPLKKSEAEVSSTKAPKGQRVNMGPSFFQRLGRSIGSIFRKCLPGEECYKFEHGGWTGYPDHTMYSSAMKQFDDVRRLTKYGEGGETELENVPVTYVTPANILNPRVTTPADFHVYQAPRTYVPGQNAAKGTAEPDYTIETLLMPLPKIGKALKGAEIETAAANKLGKQAANITQDKLENYIFNGKKYNVWEDLGRADKTIQTEGKKILKDLSSEEGIKRLKGQFRKANPDLTEDQIHYLTGVRLNEVMEAVRNNQTKFFREHPEWVDADYKFETLFPLNNAHFSPKWNPFDIEHVPAPSDLFPELGLKEANVSKFKLQKSSPYQSFTNPDFEPGSISLGKNLEQNVRVLDHEIGHAVQKEGYTPIDQELRYLATPRSVFDKMFHKFVVERNPELKRDYNYFMKGSNKSEPYAFLREQRRKMLEKGVLNEMYDPVNFNKLVETRLNAFANTGENFVEGDRLIKFIPPWKYGKLAKIMNEAPAVIPGLAGTSAAGYIASQKSQPPIQKQGGKVTWQIID